MKKQKVALSKLSLKKDTIINDLTAIKGGDSLTVVFTICITACAGGNCGSGTTTGPQHPTRTWVELCSQSGHTGQGCGTGSEQCGGCEISK